MAAKNPRLDIYTDTAGFWRWRFVATNGKTMADGAEGYTERRHAIHGAEVTFNLATLGSGFQPSDDDTVHAVDRGIRVRIEAWS